MTTTPPKGTEPVPELDATTVGTFDDPPTDAGQETASVTPQAEPAPAEDDRERKDRALIDVLRSESPRLTVEPPMVSMAGRITFEVQAPDRNALVEAIVDTLRAYRPEVRGWWVVLAAEGELPSVAQTGQPVIPWQWTGKVTACPWTPGMPEPKTTALDDEEAFYIEVACRNCPTDGHGQPTRTGWTVEAGIFAGTPYALAVVPTGPNEHVDQADERWLQSIINRELTGQHPIAREQALVETLVQAIAAFRETRDFVDPSGAHLPAVAGWAWFDWLTAAQVLITHLGFTNANEWHPEAEGAARKAHVPAPPLTPRPAPQGAEEDYQGVWDRRGRRGNADADITGTQPVAAEPQGTVAMGLIPIDPSEPIRRRTGETAAITARPPRRPGRFSRAWAAWKNAGQTPTVDVTHVGKVSD